MGETVKRYRHEVEHARSDKDAFFARSPDSPIPEPEREGFDGLRYFDVDPAYRIEVPALRDIGEGTERSLEIQTSDGQLRPARRAGWLDFSLDDRPLSLMAYQLAGGDEGGLFVPFRDATSGTETYGAGRYLDLEPEEDGSVVLDFNLAYNPWCAYSDAWSCPLPPAENRLPVPVRAGERT